ncbi:primosomal replication protein PriC [Otariodibacter oris]|uniref:Restart primosome assembly protein PriC n=1 Tax=Otariodibacter oris TaxID=1032623 RepID=A0A420XIX5_9PAST|nr:primosomal replication protein PriC [Otariodibacter oris]QGM80747.1 hypothetical protein A6A10_04670 [Otariodibacter oris]RKR77088.1 restart primosome assembly protein PriC [Otariodibacter oris]
MNKFVKSIEDKCSIFEAFHSYEIVISSMYFSKSKGNVISFVNEIKLTAKLATQQNSLEYAEYYAQKLISQFVELKTATDKLLPQQNISYPKFISHYRVNKKLTNLSSDEKLQEYQKALRALNEKLSWLIEQNYLCTDNKQRQIYQEKIYETEYRKQKCMDAINTLR